MADYSPALLDVSLIKKGMNVGYRLIRFSLMLLLVGTLSASSFAQNRRSAPPQASKLFNVLPPSDAVAIVKLRQVLNDAMPKLLSTNPDKLAQANAQIEQFKTRTGLDPRSFEEMVFGVRYSYPSEGVTKLTSVAIANGTFSSGAMVAAGRIATNGKYREEQHRGKTIYIFNLDQQIKLLGVLDIKVGELAVAPLDANTLALGDLQIVRETLDQKRGAAARANAELIALANRNPTAIVGFGGNISEQLRANLSITNDAIARDLTAVRQVYGSVGFTEKDVVIALAARTVDEPSARNLGNTIEALKQFGALLVNRLPAAKAALARSALNSLTITNQGNELQITTSVAQTEIAPIMGGD
jgi:hypothetical protein